MILTLKELLLNIYTYGHFRIYEPNRDCLIWESFFKIHSDSPLYRASDTSQIEWGWFVHNGYYDDNPYIEPECRYKDGINELDEQTQLMLEKYGDYKVTGIEACQAQVEDVVADGHLVPHNDRNGRDLVNCLDIYIIYNSEGE